MNAKTYLKLFRLLPLIILPFLFFFTGCHHGDEATPDVLKHKYNGNLTIVYTNTYPPWSVTQKMDVEIEKVHGTVTFSNAILSYSGDTIIDGDSKIERSGQWQINPTGVVKISGDDEYLEVDAHVIVQNDATRIYAKDNDGNWVLVNESQNSESPNSDLSFNLLDSTIDGSVVGVTTPVGGIVWTLTMVVF